jgi:HlyD family secretion protein
LHFNRDKHVRLEAKLRLSPAPGTISYISDQAEFTPKIVQTSEERVNLMYLIKIELDNPDHDLKPGMPADCMIDFGDMEYTSNNQQDKEK